MHQFIRPPKGSLAQRLLLSTALAAIAATGGVSVAAPVIAEDFEAGPVQVAASGSTATVGIDDGGTIDSYMGRPGRCAVLSVTASEPQADTRAGITLTLNAVASATTDLASLTLAADLLTDRVGPVGVRLASLDDADATTGVLAGTVFPPVAGAWYRHSVDLSTLKPVSGRFDPTAKRMRIGFDVAAPATGAVPGVVRVDNISLAAPSYYVSEKGDDHADGKSAATAFATVQRGIDAAGPGDVVMVLNGTYRNTSVAGIATVAKAGTPAKWITVRSAPGHSPKLVNTGWEVFKINPGTAYFELRGLDCSGNRAHANLDQARADGLIKEKDGKKYPGDPQFNGNGISAEGRQATKPALRPHHLRFIGNRVHDNCGGGISAIACDYVTAEGNDVRDNCNFMRYGGSGISFLNLSNFDDTRNHHAFVLNNALFRNRCYVPWAAVGHMSDGNNIIIDVNRHEKTLGGDYHARSLVANNLCVGAGGGGITVTTSSHVDIVNNTLFHNVQTDELAKQKYPWGDLFFGGPLPNCQDVRAYNNIVWSTPGRSIVVAGRVDDFTLKNNVYFGDANAAIRKGDAGDDDNLVVNPKLAKPSINGEPDDFRPLPDSPAVGHAGAGYPGIPPTDLAGVVRPTAGPVTAGALLPVSK